MKTNFKAYMAIAALLTCMPAMAQLDLSRLFSGGQKALQALTLTDAQMSAYVAEYIAYSDQENQCLPDTDPYAIRLAKLTQGLTSVEGIPLNFKVYKTADVNAFACADGSVRVYTGLMDIMSDDEVLGVIGHEIGHVAHHDSKRAFQSALVNSALKDAIASTDSRVAALTDSQLSQIGDALGQAKFSRKQETQADDYGYEFLKEHGKNPYAMALAFQKLKQLEDQASSSSASAPINQLFSTHPDIEKRISRMEKKAKKEGYIATYQQTANSSTQSATNSTTSNTQKTSNTNNQVIQNAKTSDKWSF